MVIKLENKFLIYVTRVFDECSLSFFLFKLKIAIYKLNEKNILELIKEQAIYEASTYKQLFLYIMKSKEEDSIGIYTFRDLRNI